MKFACFTLVLASTTFIAFSAYAQQKQNDSGPQHGAFYADEQSFEPRVPIPPKVLDELVRTEPGRQGLEFASVRGKPVLADLFRAVEVHLSASKDPALLVRGVGWMSGADNDWFWIVNFPRQQQPKIILFCGANSVELLNSKSRGFRDVSCVWSSASETVTRLYRFTKGRYKLRRKTWTENGPVRK